MTTLNESADALFSAAIAAQSQKTQLAQYAIQQAAKFMQENKYDKALKEFKKAVAFDPQNDTAFTYIGKIYLSQGKTSDAINAFKEVVKLQPTSVTARVNLGNAYLQAKQYADSEKQFKAGARMDPLNPLPDYTLGHQYLLTDRLAEAEAQFKKVEKVSPRDANVFYSLGSVYNKQGRYEDAVKSLEKALQLKKSFPSANYELGVAYANLGQTDKAEAQLSILSKSDPTQAADLKFILDKPKIITMDTTKSGGFAELLGAGTPVWMLDPTLLITPNSSKEFNITFQFNNEMDINSVTKITNWSISRGNSTASGFYNNTMPVTSREAAVMPIPLAVTYNAVDRTATISFRISQNATGDATIDPSHLVFKFSGKDAAGRNISTSDDEIDGFTMKAF